jgi:biopolymer transport protein ExbD
MRINSLKEGRKPLLMIIPMIDIIFFLLVFFMMSMLTMVTQKTIALNLPKATIAKVDTTKTVPVSITEDGRLFLEQNLVSEEELARRLVSLKTEKLTVVLRGDEKTDYGTVVGVMDVIRRTGIERVSIATEGRR